MVSYRITQVKQFMQIFLTGEIFDGFYFTEAELTMGNRFQIDGRLQRAFYSEEEQAQLGERELLYYAEIRPHLFGLVKGKKTPLSFRVVLTLPQAAAEQLATRAGLSAQQVEAFSLVCSIRFEKGALSIVTATAAKAFTLDKTIEHLWDEELGRFLREKGVECEKE